MSKQEIQQKIDELKMEYVRIQGDIEKLESTGHSVDKLEERLSLIEETLSRHRKELTNL
ncbi:SE1832 family protein [Bacillus sp. J37]|uniref:SE1832 family protein n=1 Tax=Bacillus sp. J37 TaxID=935837 RepID=UPI0004BC438B|nr:SE1832 family protein [Bacillus sp. J37]